MDNNIIITCGCGCGDGFEIIFKYHDEHDCVYLSTTTSGFYAMQDSFTKRLSRRIKAAWFMLRGKEFLLHEVIISKERWNNFVDEVNKIGKFN